MIRFPAGSRSPTVVALALVVSACTVGPADRTGDEVGSSAAGSSQVDLVEVDGSEPGAAGWSDHRTAEVYLDADDEVEFVTVASRVQREAAGSDEQLWTVVVGEADLEKTVVYSRVVSRGHIEVVAAQNDRGAACLMILERTPTTLRAYRIEYQGPGEVSTTSLGEWSLEPNVDWYGQAPLPIQSVSAAR